MKTLAIGAFVGCLALALLTACGSQAVAPAGTLAPTVAPTAAPTVAPTVNNLYAAQLAAINDDVTGAHYVQMRMDLATLAQVVSNPALAKFISDANPAPITAQHDAINAQCARQYNKPGQGPQITKCEDPQVAALYARYVAVWIADNQALQAAMK
jgi:hypothetical protein